MAVNTLPKTVTRQRRDCDLNPGPSESESGTLTTRLPSHYCIVLKSFAGARQMALNLNGGLVWPYGLHVDEERRRLYVTEWNHGRILRLDLP